MRHLANENIEIIEGPVQKSGAVGAIESVYFLDPDSDLIEVSLYKNRAKPRKIFKWRSLKQLAN